MADRPPWVNADGSMNRFGIPICRPGDNRNDYVSSDGTILSDEEYWARFWARRLERVLKKHGLTDLYLYSSILLKTQDSHVHGPPDQF
jgi:hypothetical protein